MENRGENKFKWISFVGFIVTYLQRNCLRHPIEQLGIYLRKNMFINNNCVKQNKRSVRPETEMKVESIHKSHN